MQIIIFLHYGIRFLVIWVQYGTFFRLIVIFEFLVSICYILLIVLLKILIIGMGFIHFFF